MNRLVLPLLLLTATPLCNGCKGDDVYYGMPRDPTLHHVANTTCGGTKTMVNPGAKITPLVTDNHAGMAVSAMIGQVNGMPILASDILLELEPQLIGLGSTLEPQAFIQESRLLLGDKLNSHITNLTVLARAKAGLDQRQIKGLAWLVERQREELLRRHGQGSLARTESALIQRGTNLQRELQSYRERMLVNFYIQQEVIPMINVSRRDIERYYADNLANYRHPARRTVRLMRVPQQHADTVSKKLADNVEFLTLSSNAEYNTFNSANGGLLSTAIEGQPTLAFSQLNPLIASLDTVGQIAGPKPAADGQTIWYTQLEAYEPAADLSLMDVQLSIEQTLSQRQRQILSEKIFTRARRESSFTDPNIMLKGLLEVATARYMNFSKAQPLTPQS